MVEPHSLVAASRTWFLVCWDVRRAEWRTFRVDRMSRFFGTRLRFAPRELPAGDAADFVASAVSSLRNRHRAEVDVNLPLTKMKETFGRWSEGAVAIDDGWSTWTVDAESREQLLGALAWIPRGVEYRVRAESGFLDYAREAGARLSASLV